MDRTTIAAALAEGAERLHRLGEAARREAQILLAAALGRPRTYLLTHAEEPLEATSAARWEQWLQARAAGTPLGYLLGTQEFWSLELEVSPAVLSPRPETELLVECALQWLPTNEGRSVLDLGTGSGAIALAIAKERPSTAVVATDCSEAALEVARRNAARWELARIGFFRGDWYAALPTGGNTRFDLIVSNPPYIAAGDPALQAPELQAEPQLALTPGATGLEAIERIAAGATDHLLPGGRLAVEHGATQGAAVRSLFARYGLHEVRTWQDLAGRDRVTSGASNQRSFRPR